MTGSEAERAKEGEVGGGTVSNSPGAVAPPTGGSLLSGDVVSVSSSCMVAEACLGSAVFFCPLAVMAVLLLLAPTPTPTWCM